MTEKQRCPWLNLRNSEYVEYHDQEWGVPVHNDQKHFELLCLEGAQAGLSWETILKKRITYQEVFKNFDPYVVSKFSDDYLNKILKNPGIVRNKLKVFSVRKNARAFLAIQKEFGSFDEYIWAFSERKIIYNKFKSLDQYPAKTPLSEVISKDLKKRGFSFVGPTIIYAYLQASGIVNDHSTNCFLSPLNKIR